jgi:phosphatidylglycerophosphate synthase
MLAVPIIMLILRGRPGDYPIAGILIICATLSDGLDGFAARRFNMASLFGAMFDLTADRFIMSPALLLLSIKGRFATAAHFFPLCPWPYSGYVVLGDFIVLCGIVSYIFQRRKNPSLEFPHPPYIVKATFSFQIMPVLYVSFIQRPNDWLLAVLMYLAVLFTFLSTVAYLKKGSFVFTGKKA